MRFGYSSDSIGSEYAQPAPRRSKARVPCHAADGAVLICVTPRLPFQSSASSRTCLSCAEHCLRLNGFDPRALRDTPTHGAVHTSSQGE
jgi:hypothetical protein